MRILLVGAGGVGNAIAKIAAKRSFYEAIIVSDYSLDRAEDTVGWVAKKHPEAAAKFSATKIDASSVDDVVSVIKEHKITHLMNAVEPKFVPPLFEAAEKAGINYLDMAMSLSLPHPENPYELPGLKLGDKQFERHADWEKQGTLALVGLGVEPGLSNVMAKYAQDYLFSEVDEFAVRDGANLVVRDEDGNEIFAPSFSIWTTIEECLNPPVIWEKDKGWYTTEPFSEPEIFNFPEGIGPVECVNVEHEEVLMIPRFLNGKRVTFKYGLGNEFISVLKTLNQLKLDSVKPIRVRSANGPVEVAPRDVVAAALPDPATIGPQMEGKTCAGVWVTGKGKDGKDKSVYLYQVADNQETMAEYESQCVVWQTAFNPVVGLELLANGTWSGSGVLGPEAFDAKPFLDLLAAPESEGGYGIPWGIQDV
ncbi:MAG: saccharopine dehydrogenase NADP-binding domain-containing protein [Microbacteriaceae bacterium]|nr:saccharopine dehydrogenase NADP-binding domain-containing protein [Microbacteriaceae bacterium]